MSVRRNAEGSGTPGSMAPPPARTQQPRSMQQVGPSQVLPPPSSLANYIKAAEEGDGRDEFQNLLDEILGPEGQGNDDIATNHKLVTTVTVAGLSSLLVEQSGASGLRLYSQASSSLHFINLVIENCPGILFSPPPAEASPSEQQLLYLWLLASLVPLLGHPNAVVVRDEISETIEAIITTALKLHQGWMHLKTTLQYLRSCSKCVVQYVKTVGSVRDVLYGAFRIELPGPGFSSGASPVEGQPVPDNIGISFLVNGLRYAAETVIHIFLTLHRLIRHREKSWVIGDAVGSIIWAQQDVFLLWESLAMWSAVPQLHNEADYIRRSILMALDRALEGPYTNAYLLENRELYLTAIRFAAETLGRPAEQAAELDIQVANVLLQLLMLSQSSPAVAQDVRDLLSEGVAAVLKNEDGWNLHCLDFRSAILRFIICLAEDRDLRKMATERLQKEGAGESWGGEDPGLKKKFERILPDFADGASQVHEDGPRKRRRLNSPQVKATLAETLISDLNRDLGQRESNELTGLGEAASRTWNVLENPIRLAAIEDLGLLSCALAGSLKESLTPAVPGDQPAYFCCYCDVEKPHQSCERSWADGQNSELFKTLEGLLELDEFQESFEVRTVAMDCLRRLLNHTQNLIYLDIVKSPLGAWCLTSLRSSHRILRIAAGRNLPSFLNFSHHEELLGTNRVTILEYLASINEGAEPSLQEGCVLAYGQLARVSTGLELNLVLIRLVGYLGNNQPFIATVAYNEIQSTAEAHDVSVRKLLSPFWQSISVDVVSNLVSRPQYVGFLAELLAMPVAEFVAITREFTLPWLVLQRKTSLIERMARHVREDGDVTMLCHEHMAEIMSLLLVQNREDLARDTKIAMENISSGFKNISIGSLVWPVAIETTVCMLKNAPHGDKSHREHLRRGLHLVAECWTKATDALPTAKYRKDLVKQYVESNILGVCAHFSDTLKDIRGKASWLEKQRCLYGIAELAVIAQGALSPGLPQIFTCLQDALEDKELRTCSLSAWSTLIRNLPQERHLQPWIGPTFAIILQFWASFDSKATNIAQELVMFLFERNLDLLLQPESMVPSMSGVPLLEKLDSKLQPARDKLSLRDRIESLIQRCSHENVAVVESGLLELVDLIKENQEWLHESAKSAQPDAVISDLIRCLLDIIVVFKDPAPSAKPRVEQLCAICLGLIGAVDPNRIDAPRSSNDMMVLSNFEKEAEIVEFCGFFLEHRLVKAFKSARDTKIQKFLAYAMQELLKFGQLSPGLPQSRKQDKKEKTHRGWESLSQQAQLTLRPYLNTKYILETRVPTVVLSYPIFSPHVRYRDWLQNIVLDLLSKPGVYNTKTLFEIFSRIIRYQDRSIPTFLLPFVVLHVLISGTPQDRENIKLEFLTILQCANITDDPLVSETIRNCSETVFSVIDHLTKFVRDKRAQMRAYRSQQARAQHRHLRPDEADDAVPDVEHAEALLSAIPPDLMGMRSLECNSHARALLYWEQYIREVRDKRSVAEMDSLYRKMQDIYSNIDEPDGVEGISTQLHVLDPSQQTLEHRKAGRWDAAQTWYEMVLKEEPSNINSQLDLITCLKDAGQTAVLLDKVDEMMAQSKESRSKLLTYAVEASWMQSRWDELDRHLTSASGLREPPYEIRMGRAISALRRQDGMFGQEIAHAREGVIREMTHSFTGTVRQCHNLMVRLHALSELETIASEKRESEDDCATLAQLLDRRLGVMGTYTQDKQHVLSLRRAAFSASANDVGLKGNLASAWLHSSKLARKIGQSRQSYDAVLHALRLSPPHATIEHAKLLWQQGQHRKAIHTIEVALQEKNTLLSGGASMTMMTNADMTALSAASGKIDPQGNVPAKASLLLARWLDAAGQTYSAELQKSYQHASTTNLRWEQGHYYLGRYYSKLFDTQRALPPEERKQTFIYGETCKLVIFSFLRALAFGSKYIYKTLPRVLTLWLDFGQLCEKRPTANQIVGTEDFIIHTHKERLKILKLIHDQMRKYGPKLPKWMFFTAFPQIMSRVNHEHPDVYNHLEEIIVSVTTEYPRQALWYITAVQKSLDKTRRDRGTKIVSELRRQKGGTEDLKKLLPAAVKLSDQMLLVCNGDLKDRTVTFQLKRDLGFKHEVVPIKMVMPIESAMTVALPSPPAAVKNHTPFVGGGLPTMETVLDEGDVMASLIKPRKIKIIGSNGRTYVFLCKPKDDLRKDARLMQFNGMINRFLKKDLEATRRTLNIRTYHVTPLNEDCGMIEWVHHCRALRDIILKNLKARGITINPPPDAQYGVCKELLDATCQDPEKNMKCFTETLLKEKSPSVFHEWFLETFSEPAAWFGARLRYARTTSVISMVGHVLGLGDRHGENIMFDEKTGDTVHVDFNCLFDKGLTFDKAEMVPFRLTHNIVDAFGVTGYEGVFRKSSEVVMRLLRDNEEALMTVLETFLHDPAADMGKQRRRTNGVSKSPDSPKAVLDKIQKKLRGILDDEDVPLSVEGQVEMLIRKATDPKNLCRMYIGWCPMF